MVRGEEVTQVLVRVENVGPPLAEDGHSEILESLDPDLVEDLIPNADLELFPVEEVRQPTVRPLDGEFFASVQNYVKGLPSCRADKLLPDAVANNRHDQEVLDRLFSVKESGADSLPKILSYDLSEPSLTISNGGGKPYKILFYPVLRNPNFFLRLSDPSSYEHRKSLFLWRMVSSIRLEMLNARRLRRILKKVKTYAVNPENERMTKYFEDKLVRASEQEKECLILLGETRWTEYFLASVKGSNVLAQQIWHALRGVPAGLMEDVLRELRTRFKRGRIWENDPWWPNDR